MAKRGFAVDGEKLSTLHRQRGWSQQDLAAHACLDVRTVAKLRRGGSCDSSTLRALSQALKVDPDVLLNDSIATASLSQSQDMERGSVSKAASVLEEAFRIEQAWKVTDLRAPYQFGQTPCGILCERYRVARLSAQPANLVLPYLTWGEGIECLCKPKVARWNKVVPESGNIVHSQKQWELCLPLPRGRAGAAFELGPVQLQFINAFHASDQQWWQTRAAYEIDCLIIQILFDTQLPCSSVAATWAPPGQRKFVPFPGSSPFVLPDGTVASWHIPRPLLGAFYKLAWTW